jgi:hypothetical protein
MDVKYKYLKENTTLMIIDGEPFSEITRVKDNRLQILTADGEYFDDDLRDIEEWCIEKYTRDHIDKFPGTKIHQDYLKCL